MKITKLVHSCLLVEMPEPVNRTALFDPGTMSEEAVNVASLEFLDDIFITHEHFDHLSVPLLKQLVAKFPEVRITGPQAVVDIVKQEGLHASSEAPEGVSFFEAPHEAMEPLGGSPPQNTGIHYLDRVSHPGDSHHFTETKPVLALPVQAPWGATVNAVSLALNLKPQFIVPIHDWHWSDAARSQMYDRMEEFFGRHDIAFCKPQTGQAFTLDV